MFENRIALASLFTLGFIVHLPKSFYLSYTQMVIEKIIDENASREADKYVAQKKRRESAKNKHITVNVKKTFLTNFSFS